MRRSDGGVAQYMSATHGLGGCVGRGAGRGRGGWREHRRLHRRTHGPRLCPAGRKSVTGLRRCFVAALLAAGSLAAQTLDVPLTVTETAGVHRTAEPVTFGVPLPKRLLIDTERLRLYGPGGKPVPAAFRVASRWWEEASGQDSSVRWCWRISSPMWRQAAKRSTASRYPTKRI